MVPLSGDQNGDWAPSAVGTGRDTSESRSRSHNWLCPSCPTGVNVKCRPSGDRDNSLTKLLFSGKGIWKRIDSAGVSGFLRKATRASHAEVTNRTRVTTAQGKARRHRAEAPSTVPASAGSGTSVRTSSSEIRASPMSRSRCLASFCRHRCNKTRTRIGVAVGSSDQSGSDESENQH